MAYYNYVCNACKQVIEQIKGSTLTNDEELEVIFETSHPMVATKKQLLEATKCPRCGGSNTDKVLRNVNIVCYVRGNGYLDKAGCHRDMNLFKLEQEDPYAELREPGEVTDLKIRLQKSGQHDSKRRHFTTH